MLRAIVIAGAGITVVSLLYVGLLFAFGLLPYQRPRQPQALVVQSTHPPSEPRFTQSDLGARIYYQKCATCHTIYPDPDLNSGLHFYDLYGSTRVFTDDTTAIADEAYIRESITDPGAKIVQGYENHQPPFVNLSERDLNDLVAFFRAISTQHNEPYEPLNWHQSLLERR